jgi:hypothetical protein
LQRRRKRSQRAVGGHLTLAGVHTHLGTERDRSDAVAPRDEVTLDLHVLEHVGERTLVLCEQSLEDELVLVRELAGVEPLGRLAGNARIAP